MQRTLCDKVQIKSTHGSNLLPDARRELFWVMCLCESPFFKFSHTQPRASIESLWRALISRSASFFFGGNWERKTQWIISIHMNILEKISFACPWAPKLACAKHGKITCWTLRLWLTFSQFYGTEMECTQPWFNTSCFDTSKIATMMSHQSDAWTINTEQYWSFEYDNVLLSLLWMWQFPFPSIWLNEKILLFALLRFKSTGSSV